MPGHRVVGWLVAPSKDFFESPTFAIHWDGCCCYCVMLYCFNDVDRERMGRDGTGHGSSAGLEMELGSFRFMNM